MGNGYSQGPPPPPPPPTGGGGEPPCYPPPCIPINQGLIVMLILGVGMAYKFNTLKPE